MNHIEKEGNEPSGYKTNVNHILPPVVVPRFVEPSRTPITALLHPDLPTDKGYPASEAISKKMRGSVRRLAAQEDWLSGSVLGVTFPES